MRKSTVYRYLGTNGIIDSPIYIEGAYSVRYYSLFADEGKVLTKDHKRFVEMVTVPEVDLDLWVEIDKEQ